MTEYQPELIGALHLLIIHRNLIESTRKLSDNEISSFADMLRSLSVMYDIDLCDINILQKVINSDQYRSRDMLLLWKCTAKNNKKS